jgi:hypothetical protein
MTYWYTWGPGAILAFLGLVALSWRALRAIFRFDSALPTLLEIADQFKPNGGSSLHDQLLQIRTMQERHEVLDDGRFARIETALAGIEASVTNTTGQTPAVTPDVHVTVTRPKPSSSDDSGR